MDVQAPSSNRITIMLVDDSAVIRGGLSRILKTEPSIEIVASVADGAQGIIMAGKHKPDIIITDIEMPVMDGLTALPQYLKASPDSKVVMFSTLTEKGAAVTMKAMTLGAVECLVKPQGGQGADPNSEFGRYIITLTKNLAPKKTNAAIGASSSGTSSASSDESKQSLLSPKGPLVIRNNPMDYKGKPSVVAIGSSTGGPQALFKLLSNFKGFDVPIVITQHMPATFTRILATHINQNAGVSAFEGEEGMRLEAGKVYVAPGGYHMLFNKNGNDVTIKLDTGPQENFCRPAVDPMFRSIAEIYGSKVLGIIVTGMGKDGLKGSELLVEKGARVIAQDEKTSVVWGMPGAVSMAGICSAVLPLEELGPWARKAVLG
ncbi:MAG: chemotaxis response regulator protein-glutamate methylesterase [Micavibrio sp.]|nr:chemotaxis response regulator protein-glutamate methylesterase [Micavibrio sp.]